MPDIKIGVGPFYLAPYLDRAQVVSRVGPNEVQLSSVDRWAEPLPEGVVRTLEENLIMYLEPKSLALHPWTSLKAPDYAVELNVVHFERNADGDAELWALWAVRTTGTSQRTAILDSRIVEPTESKSTERLVEGLSRGLGRLAGEIADTIRAVHARSPVDP